MEFYVVMLPFFCHAPIFFVMIPNLLSCSQISEGKNSKIWEHDTTNWSMRKKLEHDINLGEKGLVSLGSCALCLVSCGLVGVTCNYCLVSCVKCFVVCVLCHVSCVLCVVYIVLCDVSCVCCLV